TSITHYKKIDIFGGVVKEQLTCCNVQTVSTNSGNGYSMPTSVVKGDPSGPTLTTQFSSDFNTSVRNSTTDPNNLTTTVTARDAALRPTTITLPSSATRTAAYNDATQTVTQSTNYTDDGSSKTVTETGVLDGWGRVIQQLNPHGGQVNTE